jgi:hypothetical protein
MFNPATYGMTPKDPPVGPPQDVLNAIENLLEYDPHTGALTWKLTGELATRNALPSDNVGVRSYNAPSTIPLVVDLAHHNRPLLAHYIAWFLYTGNWSGRVVHLDHDRKNNAIANLRRSKMGKPAQPR